MPARITRRLFQQPVKPRAGASLGRKRPFGLGAVVADPASGTGASAGADLKIYFGGELIHSPCLSLSTRQASPAYPQAVVQVSICFNPSTPGGKVAGLSGIRGH